MVLDSDGDKNIRLWPIPKAQNQLSSVPTGLSFSWSESIVFSSVGNYLYDRAMSLLLVSYCCFNKLPLV